MCAMCSCAVSAWGVFNWLLAQCLGDAENGDLWPPNEQLDIVVVAHVDIDTHADIIEKERQPWSRPTKATFLRWTREERERERERERESNGDEDRSIVLFRSSFVHWLICYPVVGWPYIIGRSCHEMEMKRTLCGHARKRTWQRIRRRRRQQRTSFNVCSLISLLGHSPSCQLFDCCVVMGCILTIIERKESVDCCIHTALTVLVFRSIVRVDILSIPWFDNINLHHHQAIMQSNQLFSANN